LNKMSENITKSENNSQNNKNVTKKRKINGQQSQQQSSQQSTTQSTPTHQRSDQNQRSSGGQSSQQWTRLTGAPAWDLAPNINQNQTFTGRCRLFVANLPQNVSEESLRSLFGEFGQISDIYIGKGNQFAFIKMDTKHNAELAKQQLDGKPFEGRTLRVRLAAHASAIRVTQLPPFVSNELLSLAFSSFGVVERAIVSADDRFVFTND
jgi:proline- and glutamine-rich splicing factor